MKLVTCFTEYMYQHGEDVSNFNYSQRADPTMGKAVRTMIDMNVGPPIVATVLNRNKYLLYHLVSILTFWVTINTVGNGKTMLLKHFKKDRNGAPPYSNICTMNAMLSLTSTVYKQEVALTKTLATATNFAYIAFIGLTREY